MIIKVCGITNEEDALAAIDAGASALGFNFWSGSPRYATDQPWMRTLPVMKVGVFVGEASPPGWLDVAQIYGDASPDGIPVWRAVKPGDRLAGGEAYVMDISEGNGKTFDWSLAANLPAKIVLAGGLEPANVATAIATARPWGVDACSKLESAPGRKDHARMRDFILAAREGFRQS